MMFQKLAEHMSLNAKFNKIVAGDFQNSPHDIVDANVDRMLGMKCVCTKFIIGACQVQGGFSNIDFMFLSDSKIM